MGDVVELGVETTLPLPPDKVLGCAISAQLSEVVVVGWVEETGRFYLAASETDAMRIGFALDLAKATLMQNQLAKS